MCTMPNTYTGEAKVYQRVEAIRNYADMILLALNEAGTLYDREPDNDLMMYVFQSRDARIKELLSND